MKPSLLACLLSTLLVMAQAPVLAAMPPADLAPRDNGVATAQNDALLALLDFAEQHFRYPDLIKDTLTAPQWFRTGNRFVYWAATGAYRGTWVLVDARSGKGEPLLAADELQAQMSVLMGKSAFASDNPFPFYALAPDQQQILFLYQNGAYAIGLSDRRIRALAAADPLALSLQRSNTISPDGSTVAVQRDNGFAVVGSGGRVLIERSSGQDQTWEIPKTAWSPDGRILMIWRNDNRAVHKIPVVDYSDAIEKVALVPYAKAGTPLTVQELYAVEPVTGQMTRMATGAGDAYHWLAGWRPDSSEALVLRLSRDGKRLDLFAVDPRSGKSRPVLHEERSRSFVGALDFATEGWATQVFPLEDKRHFLWMSERDGWRHAYLYDYSGRLERQVTRGDFPVHQVVGTTPEKDAVLVLASAEKNAPYDRLLYRAELADGALRRLTSDPGLHRIFPSPRGQYYIDGHSALTQPRVWDVSAVDGKTSFRYAHADASALAQIHYAPPEPITVLAADGTTPLYGVLYKPWNFDPNKRYPVIDCIYAGPFATVVPWGFAGTMEGKIANALAQLGFITVVIDARGTPGRGKAFQDANYGRVGQTEIPDHVAALRQAAASRRYMDMDRVGIYGHSWGGYFALRGMLTAPDFFKAGYAGAPGALEEEAIINEPNLGLPAANPDGYRAGSNVLAAANLRGRLRIMHGTSDTSATLSTTMRMAEALIRADKQFELLIMPGQPHGPLGPARRYYDDDVRRFFLRTLADKTNAD